MFFLWKVNTLGSNTVQNSYFYTFRTKVVIKCHKFIDIGVLKKCFISTRYSSWLKINLYFRYISFPTLRLLDKSDVIISTHQYNFANLYKNSCNRWFIPNASFYFENSLNLKWVVKIRYLQIIVVCYTVVYYEHDDHKHCDYGIHNDSIRLLQQKHVYI